MANIVIASDFTKGELKIPNAVSLNASEGVNGDLQAIIDKYEKKTLLAVLGKDQYDALQLELAKQPFTEGASETAATHWQTLVNDYLKDLLLPYIYCKWLRFDEVKLSTVGPGKGKADGFGQSDTNIKYIERFNEFVDSLNELKEHLTDTEQFSVSDDFPCAYYANTLIGHNPDDTI